MALNSTTPWSPPPTSALSVSNCTAISAFYASGMAYRETSDVGYEASFNYLRSLIPSNWTSPTDGQLLTWADSWDEKTSTRVVNESVNMVQYGCDQEICHYLQLEGDPDLAGIGMMASYYLVALLATIYTTVISLESLAVLKAYKPWRKFHSWFEQTINSFLDASLLFSISLLLASIYRFSAAARHPDDADNTFIYSLINAMTVSMFSVFPPLLLQFAARNLRRRGIRAICWFVVITFVITMTILYYRWRGPSIVSQFPDEESIPYLLQHTEYHQSQAVWLVFCDLTNAHLVEALDRAIITAQVILALNLPCWIYLLFRVADTQQKDSAGPQDSVKNKLYHIYSQVWKRCGKQTRALNIILLCATMWLLLGTFTTIAVRLADGMGPWGKDRQWSIGQVLAMATFAPLIIDIIAIAKCKWAPCQVAAMFMPC
ncbi:hypothetical protein F5883DRAFT_191208 [Diaporthe sp. PMI_573]|nr:hypothetical protein F5883DRAFT_191208 [Diaporthaceae sp. PMI_573]